MASKNLISRRRAALVAGAFCTILAPGVRADSPPPPAIGGSAAVDAAAFRVTTFASGLYFPSSLQSMSDGSFLVGSSVPDASNGSFYQSTGQLLRFTDVNHDGVADGPGEVVATGITGGISSVRTAGNLVLVTSAGGAGPSITVLRQGITPAAPLTTVGTINFTFPGFWEHETYSLAVRPSPAAAGDYDVVFNVGSQNNDTPDTAGVVATTTGLLSASLAPSSLYMTTVHDAGGSSVSFSAPKQLATGLRNAAGTAFAANGDLLLEDNGEDGPADQFGNHTPESADELNVIHAADVGTKVVDFGYPYNYVRYSDGAVIGDASKAPAIAFLPKDGSQAVGANEIAVAPTGFPAGLNGGVFVGFHGLFDSYGTYNPNTGRGNPENGLVYADPATGDYFHMIDDSQPTIGHLDGLLATDDSLFVTDLADGELFGGGASTPTGAIYEITAVPEPAGAPTAIAVAAVAVSANRLRRRRPIA